MSATKRIGIRRRVVRRSLCLFALLLGCSSSASEPPPGTETGPCDGEACMPGLTCASNVCVDLDDEAGTGAQPGSMGAASNSGAEGSASEAGSESTGRSSAGSSGDSTSGPVTGGFEESGFEEGATVGGSDDPPPGCVTYAATYCGCLGEVAAPDCTVTIADNCDLLYDWCPQWYACITGLGCNFADYEAQCGTCEP